MNTDSLPWLEEARELIGVREIKGVEHEPRILKLWQDAGLSHIRDDETAWCAAFVGGTLWRAGIQGTRKPNARSYEQWGVDVLEENRLHVPLGSVLVFSRPGGESWMGHVGYAVGYNRDGRICCLGGNQRDSVSIAPFEVGRVIAARWPYQANRQLLRRIPLLNIGGNASSNEA